MNREEEIMQRAEDFQNECHALGKEIIGKSNKVLIAQDITNVFLFKKLAECEIELRALKKIVNIMVQAKDR